MIDIRRRPEKEGLSPSAPSAPLVEVEMLSGSGDLDTSPLLTEPPSADAMDATTNDASVSKFHSDFGGADAADGADALDPFDFQDPEEDMEIL